MKCRLKSGFDNLTGSTSVKLPNEIRFKISLIRMIKFPIINKHPIFWK